MANNDPTDDYYFGKETGAGTGFAGHVGNLAHQQEQMDKWWRAEAESRNAEIRRENEEKRRVREQMRQDRTSQTDNRIPVIPGPMVKSKPWSTVMAILGFLGGAGFIYAQPDPSLIAATIVGAITGLISGRFYKPILVIGVALVVLWVLF